MRILLDYRPALRDRTGVGEFAHELARALARLGTNDETTIFTSSWKDRPSPTLADELANVRIVDRQIPVRALTWAWNRLGWPPVEWLAGPVDVVHAQSPLLIPATHAAQVITIHDLDFLTHPERAEAEMRRDFPGLVTQHAARADQIIVSSQYAAREVAARLKVEADRISVCSPGVPRWASAIAHARTLSHPGAEAAGGLDAAGTSILFVGSLEPRKNIRGLLDAYALLRQRRPDAPRLVLAGRARGMVAADLARTSMAPLAGHVQQLGYVSHEQKQALYRSASMLVLPSFEEGFGLPVLEAMACAVPVVISNRGSLPEVAGDAARPVDPEDVAGLAAAMERLLDPAAAREAIVRGLSQAARYSWDGCARSARDAYSAAIASRARRR